MDSDLSFQPLLKIYQEAFESRDEEHIWYHFWLEVFVHLNEQTRTSQQRLSVAPQRRYVEATRPENLEEYFFCEWKCVIKNEAEVISLWE